MLWVEIDNPAFKREYQPFYEEYKQQSCYFKKGETNKHCVIMVDFILDLLQTESHSDTNAFFNCSSSLIKSFFN